MKNFKIPSLVMMLCIISGKTYAASDDNITSTPPSYHRTANNEIAEENGQQVRYQVSSDDLESLKEQNRTIIYSVEASNEPVYGSLYWLKYPTNNNPEPEIPGYRGVTYGTQSFDLPIGGIATETSRSKVVIYKPSEPKITKKRRKRARKK